MYIICHIPRHYTVCYTPLFTNIFNKEFYGQWMVFKVLVITNKFFKLPLVIQL